jgi:hypothetical protein
MKPPIENSPTTECTVPECGHRRYWHDGHPIGNGKCTRADCPCTSGQYPK